MISCTKHYGDNLGFSCRQCVTVQTEEDYHRKECNPLVAVAIGRTGDYAESVRGAECGNVDIRFVFPLVASASQCRFEGVLVPDAVEPAVFANLIEVNRVYAALGSTQLADP